MGTCRSQASISAAPQTTNKTATTILVFRKYLILLYRQNKHGAWPSFENRRRANSEVGVWTTSVGISRCDVPARVQRAERTQEPCAGLRRGRRSAPVPTAFIRRLPTGPQSR